MPIELNALESARFGITAARLTDLSAPLDRVNAAARAQGVQMITARVDSNHLPLVQALEEDGYRLMDMLVYYSHDLARLPEPGASPAGETLRRASPADAAAVAEVAKAAFRGYLGHFHSDPRLSGTDADAAYVEWAQSSVTTCDDTAPAFVAVVDGRIAAFLTTDMNVGEIVLNAVLPQVQGQGIYGRLVDQALQAARRAGCRQLSVSTQVNNIAPQRTWCRRGFRPLRSLYTLHKWFSPE